ncbi:phosphatidyl-N-methylethanolamine N-methyltransferase [[Candida] jaroonii]|uniref:Phosphatidyl-N-methylethanolamine N-methyltransferase n=1 Tax=[Candida] jaroonii TaxID=467808 RepID=A0ACA9YEM7_9ASCO|nr:phosphatidyl-N-methylethanolamine N-methyltransferase [[Candida] jaroonii]
MSLIAEAQSLITDTQFLIHNIQDYINIDEKLLFSLGCIAFNPIFWNIVARLEYNTHFLTKICGGAYNGCYLLALTIFSLGIYRDYVYHEALMEQPTYKPFVDSIIIKSLSVLFFGFGNILVVTSMWGLGVTGTYLGDYFGILMSERVTGFPFNVNDNPMYNGSTLCFLGTALWYGKPTGIVVSGLVFVMYKIALLFEEPFTAKIYQQKAENEKKNL